MIVGRDLYQSAVLRLNPVGYWRLGETGGNLADSSGNGYSMTVHGSPAYGDAGAIVADSNTAVGFNGSNTWFTGAHISQITGNPVTLEGWINPASFASGALMAILTCVADAHTGYALWVNAATQKVNLGNENGGNFDSTTSVLLDAWQHVVGVINGAASAIYINGAPAGTGTVNVGISASPIRIASETDLPNLVMNGVLDELAVYNKVLTAAQIANHYNLGKTGYTPSPQLAVRF